LKQSLNEFHTNRIALKSMKQGEANQLLLIARAAAEILQCGTGDHAKRKLKIIAGAEDEGLCCC